MTKSFLRLWCGASFSVLFSVLTVALVFETKGQDARNHDAAFTEQVATGWSKLVANDLAVTSITLNFEEGKTLSPQHSKKNFKKNQQVIINKGPTGVFVQGARILEAGNPLYSFQLKREGVESPWSVGKLVDREGDVPGYLRLFDDPEQAKFLYPVSCYIQMTGPALLAALQKGTMKLTRKRGEAGVIIVTFRLAIPNRFRDTKQYEQALAQIEQLPAKYREQAMANLQKRAMPDAHVGEMTLDPASDYAIVAASSEFENNPSRQLSLERKVRRLETPVGSLVVCDSFRITETFKKEGVFGWEIGNFTDTNTAKVSENNFFLSHYGFPEPRGVDAPVTPSRLRWLYFLIAGAGLIAVSVVLRFVIKRRTGLSKA